MRKIRPDCSSVSEVYIYQRETPLDFEGIVREKSHKIALGLE
jgi:hypothetical protein